MGFRASQGLVSHRLGNYGGLAVLSLDPRFRWSVARIRQLDLGW
jgi:hypothetical protein